MKQARSVDAFCKLVATIGLLVGGPWTIISYFDQQRANNNTAQIGGQETVCGKTARDLFSSGRGRIKLRDIGR
jgi:hypothetical protein